MKWHEMKDQKLTIHQDSLTVGVKREALNEVTKGVFHQRDVKKKFTT